MLTELNARSIVEIQHDDYPPKTSNGVTALPWRILCRAPALTNPDRTEQRWRRVYLDRVDNAPFVIIARQRHYLPAALALQVIA